MQKTDYSGIADKYDNNILRHKIPKDENIEKIYKTAINGIKILDLACGTGNYIKAQAEFYKDYKIKWFGLDSSAEMLAKAKEKKLNAELISGDAVNLPFDNDFFDYIKIRFAYHHFSDKVKASKEVFRALKTNGTLSILNLAHDYMHCSWVYKYFPSAAEIDNKRFPSSIDLYSMLINAGFDVKAEISVNIKEFLYDDLINEVRNRDMSQLTLITEKEYSQGLKNMENDAQKNKYFPGDIAFLNYFCIKR
jgi:ubiquinone/menaquinone biosynthesis C-methylase UbiE